MHVPDDEEGNPENHKEKLVEFNQMKKAELAQIENFIHIFNDWVEETLQEIEQA